jgi:hypothetical protein
MAIQFTVLKSEARAPTLEDLDGFEKAFIAYTRYNDEQYVKDVAEFKKFAKQIQPYTNSITAFAIVKFDNKPT